MRWQGLCAGTQRATPARAACRSKYESKLRHASCPRKRKTYADKIQYCKCDPGYTGSDCGLVDSPCPHDCMGNGRCSRGICQIGWETFRDRLS